ncbi:MAG: hypothetical protein KKF52_05495, partial [Nanoarchaeota archaeon]|nr:hypothetical protein [Nanoarchaeota archaeon]
DNQSTPGYLVEGAIDEGKGRIYISKFNSNETFDSVAISANESGSLIRSMTNTSSQWCKTTEYYLGRNYWSGGVTGATTYKNNLTIMRQFTLMGDLYNTYIEPKNVNYTLGSVIPLEGSIIDDCGVNRNDASVNFTLVNGAYINSQKVTYNTPTASYKKTDYYLPTNAPLGWYNVTMISNLTNHWNGSYTKEWAFYYGSPIQLLFQNMTPYDAGTWKGGWGESPFNFTINVTSNQTVNVELWLWNTTGWFHHYNETCTDCNFVQIKTGRNFTCQDIGPWVARFNATDEMGFVNNSMLNMSFTVERDDVTINHLTGNNEYVNRSNDNPGNIVPLAVQIYDTDNETYTTDVNNETALFTYIFNGTKWITENEDENEQGLNYSIQFNPGCNYEPGAQSWNMTVKGATCQKNQTSSNFVINIVGNLDNTIDVPNGTANFTQGNSILLRAYVIDDCLRNITGLTTKYFNLTNGSDNVVKTCVVGNEEGQGWYNCTWYSAQNVTGYWNVTFYSELANYNKDQDNKQFYLSSIPVLQYANVTPSTGGWGRPNYTYTVNVTDVDGDNVTVKFWLSKDDTAWQLIDTKTCVNCDNTELKFNYTYSSAEIGNWSYKFNATEVHENSVELIGGSHILGKDTITINLLLGNNSNVNRSNLNPGAQVTLATFVYDTDASANTTEIESPTFYAYVTNQTTTWVEWDETIHGDGYYYINFDPTCNYTAAKQTWNMTVNGDQFYKNAT